MRHSARTLALVALGCLALDASAIDINFDNLAVGVTLSNQYAGVTFSANALSGGGSISGAPFATNTDMKIVSSIGSDVNDLGTPSLVSGNVLRSFSGYLVENGDPSFRVTFAAPITSFSADFASVFDPADVRLMAFNGNTLVSTVNGTSPNEQFHLAITGSNITSVIVLPGTFNDYVAVDNISYAAAVTAVPEPSVLALSSAGFALVAWAGRRRRKSSRT